MDIENIINELLEDIPETSRKRYEVVLKSNIDEFIRGDSSFSGTQKLETVSSGDQAKEAFINGIITDYDNKSFLCKKR